jgi:hypothetical protein
MRLSARIHQPSTMFFGQRRRPSTRAGAGEQVCIGAQALVGGVPGLVGHVDDRRARADQDPARRHPHPRRRLHRAPQYVRRRRVHQWQIVVNNGPHPEAESDFELLSTAQAHTIEPRPRERRGRKPRRFSQPCERRSGGPWAIPTPQCPLAWQAGSGHRTQTQDRLRSLRIATDWAGTTRRRSESGAGRRRHAGARRHGRRGGQRLSLTRMPFPPIGSSL